MKGFKGLSSILEVYNTSLDQDKKIVGIEIVKGYGSSFWPGLPIWF